MKDIPENYKFLSSHEWAKLEEDGKVTVGISDYAQDQLGDIVFVELPEIDSEVNQGDEAAVVESVKAASDVYCPLAGTIVNTNEILIEKPELVNNDPYGEGWLFRLRPDLPGELEGLLDDKNYERLLAEDNE